MTDGMDMCKANGCGNLAAPGAELCEVCGLKLALRSTAEQLRAARERINQLEQRCDRQAKTIERMVEGGYTKPEA